MIEFRGVKKIYKDRHVAIKNASFSIQKGEFVFLCGVSGAGKSSLLKMMHKQERLSDGDILVFGKSINKIKTKNLRRNMGFVFQDFDSSLLEKKTVFENVAYVLSSQGQSPKEVKRKAIEAMSKVGIVEKKKKYPHQLSGGEKQRVAIARAIVNRPSVLVCDEPTGNLDNENAETVMKYLNELNNMGATIIMTTHNKKILEDERKRTLFVDGGRVVEGRVGNEKVAKNDSIQI